MNREINENHDDELMGVGLDEYHDCGDETAGHSHEHALEWNRHIASTFNAVHGSAAICAP